ncbi:MAG: 2-hydroxyacyl-CoA dehydratase, partial [Phycisphaeraceae bacterium]
SPPLTGRQLLELKSSISGIPGDLARYEQALAELPHAPGPDRSDRVRVLLTGVPMPHGAERVAELIEDSGGLVVAADNCTGLKPILEDVDLAAPDITRAVADKYFHIPCSVMTPNEGRFTTIRELAEKYRVQCVVELIWQACLTYDVEAARVKRFAEQELGLPYLRINTDYARADSSRIAVRLEALFETVRSGADVASCHP